jgi:hypothetical protein
MEIIQDVKKGRLYSAYAIRDFDKAKEALESKGYRIISLEEQAGLRVQEGADSGVSQRGNWTKEGFVYVPSKGAFLTMDSPIMANAEQATNCHRSGKDFYLNGEQVEASLEGSIKVINTQISTNRFADEALTSFAFGENAKAYGEFLKENGINNIQFYLADYQDKPFARQAWLYGFDSYGRSGLDGNSWDLYSDHIGVRGVRASDEVAKPSVENSRVEAYTQKDIQKALESLKLAGLESQILEALKKQK